jgi:hypothetical protein
MNPIQTQVTVNEISPVANMTFNHCLSLEVSANKTKLIDDVGIIPCDPKNPRANEKCKIHCRLEGYRGGHCEKARNICICDW